MHPLAPKYPPLSFQIYGKDLSAFEWLFVEEESNNCDCLLRFVCLNNVLRSETRVYSPVALLFVVLLWLIVGKTVAKITTLPTVVSQ